MVTKTKSVDSVVAPTIKNHKDAERVGNETPLLSIIEPVKKEKKFKIEDIQSDKSATSLKKPNLLRRHPKIIMASCGVLAFLLVLAGLVGGGVYAQQSMYENKVFPGVVVWGEDASGKSMTEVQKLITEKVLKYEITIKGPDQDYKATAMDLGVNYNSDTMALGAYSRGRASSNLENYLIRARLLATKINYAPWQKLIRADDLTISPSYIIDEEKFNSYLTKISDNINITAQDSQVNVSAGQVQLKPAIYGREVQLETLKAELKGSIAGFTTKQISVETTSIKPAIVDDAAQEVMVQAQGVMKRPVVLTYAGVEYRPNQETVASWITFTKKTGDAKYTLVVDPTKMKSYFDFIGTKVNVYPVSRKVRVENVVKETEISPGANGTLVDTAVLGKAIANQLPNQASVTVAIPTYVAPFKTDYERVVIADWAKYVDINLSSQVMTACERGGVNCRQWSITSGKDGAGTTTPTGTFLVLGRSASFYMTGGTPGVDYYKVWVDTAIWFTSQGHAIHDASWRNGSFGGQDYHYNGSHGCINSPDEAATFIYNWAVVGTPIIIHY